MSQYDFGVIDPTIRDGSWLADALNQWRDSLYSMNAGPSAPAYAVDGVLWRDTSNGTAKTSIKQMQGGAWKEIWTFDSAGVINFPGATVDWANITQQAVFKAAPISLTAVNRAHFTGAPSITTTGAIAIGTTAPQGAFHARLPGYVSAIIETTGSIAAGQANGALLYLMGPEQKWDFRNWNGGVLEIWDDTAGRAVWQLNKTGVVTVMGTGFLQHMLSTTANDQSRTDWKNANRQWCAGIISGGNFGLWDLTLGQEVISITGGTKQTFLNGPTYVKADLYTRHINTLSEGNYQIWTWALRGGSGSGDAGTLKCWGTSNNVSFRWANNGYGNALAYRVDEVVEVSIPMAPYPGQFNAYRGSNITLPSGGAWAWMFFSTTTSACNAGVSTGGTFLDFGSMGNIIIWKIAG